MDTEIQTEIPSTPETDEDSPGLDIEAASDKIGESLFPETDQTTEESTPAEPLAAAPVTPSADTPALVVHEVPKSWAKETHDLWGKVDPKVQEYIKKRETDFLNGLEQYKGAAHYGTTMQKAIEPFQQVIQAQGVDAPQAVQFLLNAHVKLTTGSVEARQAAYNELGQRLGLQQTTGQSATPIDPRIQSLEQQFQQVQQTLVAQQQAALDAARTKAGQEVEAFATDPKNHLFDEVHEDIVRFIQQGDSLQDAYDKAVWANPVTREKQVQARLQTETEKARERARLDALPKNKAKSVNINSRETHRAPTEPLGKMEDTLKAVAREIRTRTTH